jgi:uncharacterized protein YifE (UPF0438 family)
MKKFDNRGFDQSEYQRYFRRHQAEYMRKKLRMLKRYQLGKAFSEIAVYFGIHGQSVRKYINTYI